MTPIIAKNATSGRKRIAKILNVTFVKIDQRCRLMTRDELICRLNFIASGGLKDDEEVMHVKADEALLEYINDPEVTKAFDSIDKWYA